MERGSPAAHPAHGSRALRADGSRSSPAAPPADPRGRRAGDTSVGEGRFLRLCPDGLGEEVILIRPGDADRDLVARLDALGPVDDHLAVDVRRVPLAAGDGTALDGAHI